MPALPRTFVLLALAAACSGGCIPPNIVLPPPGPIPVLPQGLPPPTGPTVALPACSAPGSVIHVDLSTGDNVTPGTQDPAWQLVCVAGAVQSSPVPAYAIDHAAFGGAWALPTAGNPPHPNAHWLQPDPTPTGFPQQLSGGIYVYRLVFDLPKDYCNVVIQGQFGGDNEATLTLNGSVVQGCAGSCFGTWQPFTVAWTSGLFVFGGLNVLEVTVDNQGPQSYTGAGVLAFLDAVCCQCAAQPAGMVAWYPMDDVAGSSVIHDIAGFDNAATTFPGAILPGGTTTVNTANGATAHALYFGGGYAEAPNHAELLFGAGNFAVDAWIRPIGGVLGVLRPIVDKHPGPPGAGFALDLLPGSSTQQGLRLLINGVAIQSPPSLPNIPWNTWTHVAVSVDRQSTTPGVTFYVNGNAVSVPGLPAAAMSSVDNGLPLWVGRSRRGGVAEIALDELELFRSALTAPEVQAIFNAGPASKCGHP